MPKPDAEEPVAGVEASIRSLRLLLAVRIPAVVSACISGDTSGFGCSLGMGVGANLAGSGDEHILDV